jgi:hypothetical protein
MADDAHRHRPRPLLPRPETDVAHIEDPESNLPQNESTSSNQTKRHAVAACEECRARKIKVVCTSKTLR